MHACKSKSSRKVENDKINSHTHNTQDMFSQKPFWKKTQLVGEVASLSFYVWKYGCRYKEVMFVVRVQILSVYSTSYLSWLSLLNYGTKCSQRNRMPLPPSCPVITQPHSLLVVKFDYINPQLELQNRLF